MCTGGAVTLAAFGKCNILTRTVATRSAMPAIMARLIQARARNEGTRFVELPMTLPESRSVISTSVSPLAACSGSGMVNTHLLKEKRSHPVLVYLQLAEPHSQ